LELVEPQARPMIVWQKITYQQNTMPMKSILGEGERSQVPQHKSI
jgi:hypothetical protein